MRACWVPEGRRRPPPPIHPECVPILDHICVPAGLVDTAAASLHLPPHRGSDTRPTHPKQPSSKSGPIELQVGRSELAAGQSTPQGPSQEGPFLGHDKV